MFVTIPTLEPALKSAEIASGLPSPLKSPNSKFHALFAEDPCTLFTVVAAKLAAVKFPEEWLFFQALPLVDPLPP